MKVVKPQEGANECSLKHTSRSTLLFAWRSKQWIWFFDPCHASLETTIAPKNTNALDLRLVISKGSSSYQFPGGVSSYLTPIRVSLNCYPVISTFPAILGHPIKSKANRRLLLSADWNIDKMKSENGGR